MPAAVFWPLMARRVRHVTRVVGLWARNWLRLSVFTVVPHTTGNRTPNETSRLTKSLNRANGRADRMHSPAAGLAGVGASRRAASSGLLPVSGRSRQFSTSFGRCRSRRGMVFFACCGEIEQPRGLPRPSLSRSRRRPSRGGGGCASHNFCRWSMVLPNMFDCERTPKSDDRGRTTGCPSSQQSTTARRANDGSSSLT